MAALYGARRLMPWETYAPELTARDPTEREAQWRAIYEERDMTASPDLIARARAFWAEYRALKDKYGADYDPEGEVVYIGDEDILIRPSDDEGRDAMAPIVRREWVRRDTAPIVEVG